VNDTFRRHRCFHGDALAVNFVGGCVDAVPQVEQAVDVFDFRPFEHGAVSARQT